MWLQVKEEVADPECRQVATKAYGTLLRVSGEGRATMPPRQDPAKYFEGLKVRGLAGARCVGWLGLRLLRLPRCLGGKGGMVLRAACLLALGALRSLAPGTLALGTLRSLALGTLALGTLLALWGLWLSNPAERVLKGRSFLSAPCKRCVER